MKNFNSITLTLIILLVITSFLYSQPYNGPDTGSVASGTLYSTGMMFRDGYNLPQFLAPPRNKFIPPILPDPANLPKPNYPGTYYVTDPALTGTRSTTGDTLLRNFVAIPDQGAYIPPDPYLAVGPTDIIAVVNIRLKIMDRQGNQRLLREAGNWFPGVSASEIYDPKVIYDHFSKRWVMVWLQAAASNPSTTRANYLVSVSDDSTAMGNWYNYILPSNRNGNNLAGNWADYQGVGYDDKAIYITSNQFTDAGSFQYGKIRIIPKSDLYANTGGRVRWIDIWNIYEPVGNPIFSLRPARMETPSDKFYFSAHSRYTTGTFFTVCELSNPITNPTMTVINVPVGTYYNTQNAQQLGNSNRIDGGGSNLRNEPVFKDGKLHIVHSAASGTGNQYSSARYLKINTSTMSTEEDIAFGAEPYYHFYPAVGVDLFGNVVLTYSRSSVNEYAGAYFTSKQSGSSVFSGSKVLRAGAGPYYKTFGGTRNRWGDYNGAWVDPVDHKSIWIMTEFVASENIWGTWIGQVGVISSGTACRDINVNSGWNIVSVPVNTSNMASTGVFPTATSNIYGYSNSYFVADTLKTGKGYWAKFGSPQNVQACGNIVNSVTIPVQSGWNLIGGYEKSVPTAGITSNPPNIIGSVFYGYNDAYQIADSLIAGKGYWVKANQSGDLVLPASLQKTFPQVSEELKDLPTIKITDNDGRSSSLYINQSGKSFDKFILPPMPPSGNFDVRFVGDKLVANKNDELNIILSGVTYPVTITPSGIDLTFNDIIIENGQSLNLTKQKSDVIKLDIVSKPLSFKLHQNYPNPFNPKTTIKYDIPYNSYVTLKVYDILGKEISTIVNANQSAGNYKVDFDGTGLSSGLYIIKLKTNDIEISGKMLLSK